ncbi:hypothetical protein [Pedobacter jeongneungensis]|uniref:hypothetical protein n=1 Tax=Pedobacter jeongneungensis TaxID=947309 RepID=UPI000468F93F|nr:hypothetical protein [Pedobacter jeongneungensis]
MKFEVLLNTNIVWEKHTSNERFLYTEQDDQIILLRINNFPDEPLFSVINGLDILDIEDRPEGWHLKW